MMRDGLRILIVGGGIGGMSCAIALSGHHTVELIDLDPHWRAYGTGITIQPATFRAFVQLGVAKDVLAAGYAAKGTRFRLVDGTLINEFRIDGGTPGFPASGGIMRPVLHDILSRKTLAKGVPVRLGLTIAKLREEPSGVTVRFTDGSAGEYDLIIGADGVHSKVRSMIFPGAPQPFFTGQGAFRTLAPRPPDFDVIEIYLGDIVKPGSTPVSQDQVYMFTLTPEPSADYLDASQQLRRLREALRGFGGMIGQIRDTLTPETQTVYRPLEALLLDRPWHSGRVILIGDAVHATTPQLASGACCALEDGLLLAEYLDTRATLERDLVAFTDRRFDRCRDVVESSVEIGRLELSRAPSDELTAVYTQAMTRLAEPA